MIKNNYQKQVYFWLLSGCILIVLMVVVGGITRLTESGLSMTNWKPVTGFLPPLTEEAWQEEFDGYKASPEFKHFNHHFTLSEYKDIYFWEYVHRLFGRVIGIVFIVPFLFFWLKKSFNQRIKKRLGIIFLLGLSQGVMGWLMVKSGLVDNPHVSHYRLFLHLFFAISLVLFIFYTALLVRYPNHNWKPEMALKKWTLLIFIVTLIQVAYGALVAGLKAGFLYNTYPKMGADWLPQSLWNNYPELGIMVVFEDPGTVQFIHRTFALIVVIVAFIFWRKFKFYAMPKWIALGILLQAILGVFTLLYIVPISLGVLHQLIAILILLMMTLQLFTANYTMEFKKLNN
ncbi:COX15/CtaA family protein [Brumimicrobium oceani]|uniref:Heme A synthase n=1 Tax=Brumimicrobium oceani TaxID=2100725 RepID=A0A2U2XA99_9FLAO|nr:COX15/CtaA family protein [Brumimicrobium oceani]PWH84693.1 heme A synthase [Brumimicrobium oceani]